MSSPPRPILYGYFRSSCTWRVRIAMAIKGIEYDLRPIHLVEGDQYKDEYKRLNPESRVPFLLIGDTGISQSLAILEYLEEAYPERTPLLPKDPLRRAHARALALVIIADIQPLQNISVLAHFPSPEEKAAFAGEFIHRGLAAIEVAIKNMAGAYALGDAPSFLDVCLIPQLHGARRLSLDLAPYPTLLALEKRLAALPPFIKADYTNQPDCPEDLRSGKF